MLFVASALTLTYLAADHFTSSRFGGPSDRWFQVHPLPVEDSQNLFDVGVVDANGDNLLDIFTSNHNWRQTLLLADDRGRYQDALSAWGLDQNTEFPELEISFTAPEPDKPGLYAYWLDDRLYLRAHGVSNREPWQARLGSPDTILVTKNRGFHIQTQTTSNGIAVTLVLRAAGDALLELMPRVQGLPLTLTVSGSIHPEEVHVGRRAVSPRSTTASLRLQDRHAIAWADYDGDEHLDMFINRGAVSGRLQRYPDDVRQQVRDELLVSRGEGLFTDLASQSGIEKGNCSGRHARWVDFNGDGLLDLHINCQEGAPGEARQTKQLYEQGSGKRFKNVAAKIGLDLPDHQIVSLAWLDADGDGSAELLTSENSGFYLYRNRNGRFQRVFIGRGKFIRDDKPELKHVRLTYWTYDGQLAVGDYDGDGDLDAFAASKKGNSLLVNESGLFVLVDPGSIGLPGESVTASWVDYDNDGLTDLHAVPQGLYRQRPEHKFEPTELLVLPSHTYMAGIVSWYDLDNDGYRDVLMALCENPSRHWWYPVYWKWLHKTRWGEKWQLHLYRNVGNTNHWLQVKLVGPPGNRQAIGSRVTVHTLDGARMQEVGVNEGSFFSQGHYRLYFGLGQSPGIERVTVHWPDGRIRQMKDVPVDTLLTVSWDTNPR